MRVSDITKRLSGFGLPWFGVQWVPGEAESDVARRVLALLEDRRVFYVSASLESPDHCVTSLLEVRKELTAEIGKLRKDSVLKANLRGIRAACRAFLDRVGAVRGPRAGWPFDAPWGRGDFGVALGELRATVGIHVAIIASSYKLSVEGELANMLPPKLLNREV